jgi:hypothetical protein
MDVSLRTSYLLKENQKGFMLLLSLDATSAAAAKA